MAMLFIEVFRTGRKLNSDWVERNLAEIVLNIAYSISIRLRQLQKTEYMQTAFRFVLQDMPVMCDLLSRIIWLEAKVWFLSVVSPSQGRNKLSSTLCNSCTFSICESYLYIQYTIKLYIYIYVYIRQVLYILL